MNNNQNQKLNNIRETESQIFKEEKKILREEKKILEEEKGFLHSIKRNIWLSFGVIAMVLIVGLGAGIFFTVSAGRVQIDNSEISAPSIDLAPTGPGILEATYVNEGDIVPANTVVARVGTELIKTKTDAEIIAVHNDIGTNVSAGEPVVTVIDPSELRVVGSLEEDKGLSDIRVGDKATFTVDTFGSKTFNGVVDEISPTSNQNDVVFSISDKRQINQFNVKVRFDVSKHPELKNGMSAKITVFK